MRAGAMPMEEMGLIIEPLALALQGDTRIAKSSSPPQPGRLTVRVMASTLLVPKLRLGNPGA